MSNQMKRPDLSQWPEWLRDGPVLCRAYDNPNGPYIDAYAVWYSPGYESPYIVVGAMDGRSTFSFRYAKPVYRWTPKPDEPVLWWRNDWRNSTTPGIMRARDILEYRNIMKNRGIRRDTSNHICKPVIFEPWTVGECRRRLAVGELEEYEP
jgi:hypothetical protein